jgi:biofilm PGA synthesis N-glycosyltransferase PgaC
MIYILITIIISYPIIVYPLLLFVISLFIKNNLKKNNVPVQSVKLSFLIPVFNEENVIERKIRQLISEIDYCGFEKEILVLDDGSTDKTNAILLDLKNHIPELKVFSWKNQGKWNALKELVRQSTGDLLIFTDASAHIPKEFVSRMIDAFNHQDVIVYSPGYYFLHHKSMKFWEKIYWPYERWLKTLESKVHSTLGAHGACYALFKHHLFALEKLEHEGLGPINDDFLIPTLSTVAHHGRIFYDKNCRVLEMDSLINSEQELKRRKRIARGNITMIKDLHSYFFRRRQWFLQWVLFSHKTTRVLFPLILCSLLLLSTLMSSFPVNVASFAILIFLFILKPFYSAIWVIIKEGFSPGRRW